MAGNSAHEFGDEFEVGREKLLGTRLFLPLLITEEPRMILSYTRLHALLIVATITTG